MGESRRMRKCLDDENYMPNSKSSTPPTSASNQSGKTGQTTKKTNAAIAAEVADMLAASSSSQYIMTSVLSTFAAEGAKNAGLAKPSTTSATSFSLASLGGTNSPLDPNVFMPDTPLNHSQNSVYQIPPATMQRQIPKSQAQYHSPLNPPTQQYLQPPGGPASSYLYNIMPPLPPGPSPPSLPTYMVSPDAPLNQQSVQMTQQQPLTMNNQYALLNQLQHVSLPQQPPTSNFHPLPGMIYYAQHHPSQ